MMRCQHAAYWLRGLTVAAMVHVAAAATGHAEPRAKIEALSLFVAEPGTTADLELRVGPPEALPKNAYVRIRGLPTTATLSDGFVVTPGVWSIPLAALSSLRITLPKGLSGRSDLTIALLDVDGKLLAEARSALVVAQVNLRSAIAPEPKFEPKAVAQPEPSKPDPLKVDASPPIKPDLPKLEPPKAMPKPAIIVEAPAPEQRVERAARIETPTAPTAAPRPVDPLSADTRQRNARMVEQGDKVLAQGNIATARQYYLRAAENSDGSAALKLAETYDPSELARLRPQGITGDVIEAKRWYQRAADLGMAGAAEKLAKLARP